MYVCNVAMRASRPIPWRPDVDVLIGSIGTQNRAHPVHLFPQNQTHAALMCMGSTIDSIYWRSNHDVAFIASHRPPFAGRPGGILLGLSAAADAAELQP